MPIFRHVLEDILREEKRQKKKGGVGSGDRMVGKALAFYGAACVQSQYHRRAPGHCQSQAQSTTQYGREKN